NLGARLLRVTAGQAHPETGRADGIGWAIEGLCRLTEASQDSGVTLVYENHAKPGAWQYTDFSQPPEIFLEIVAGTAGTDLGVNFDTGNSAAFSSAPLALLDRVIDRVVSVHASDTEQHGALQHVLLGTGITPFGALFGRLAGAGWDGWICMEEASNGGKDGVRAAADFVRRTWAEAAGGQSGGQG
ncbi:MAG: sugar phosphate isomerase/epimerase family protein, partial [Anaerolineae bacterium]